MLKRPQHHQQDLRMDDLSCRLQTCHHLDEAGHSRDQQHIIFNATSTTLTGSTSRTPQRTLGTSASPSPIILSMCDSEQQRRQLRKSRRRQRRASRAQASTSAVQTQAQALMLLDLARMRQWSALSASLETCPPTSITSAADSQGLGLLHWACASKAPLDLVVKLIGMQNAKQETDASPSITPMHLACQHGADTATIRVLIKNSAEQLSIRDDRGRTPLIAALMQNGFQAAHMEVVDLLARSDPSTITQELPVMTKSAPLAPTSGTSTANDGKHASKVSNDKALQASPTKTTTTTKQDTTTSALRLAWSRALRRRNCHSNYAVAVRLSKIAADSTDDVLSAVLKLHGAGHLPSALALSTIKLVLSREASVGRCHIRLAAEIIPSTDCDAVLGLLLENFVPTNETFAAPSPLSVAIKNGKSWDEGISRLLQAFPDDLSTDIGRIRLELGQCYDLSTIHRLLSHNPACFMN